MTQPQSVAARLDRALDGIVAAAPLASGSATLGSASPRPPLAWALRTPGRLIVTGAVGSAAVGVGITAFAVWRHGRRVSSPAHR